MGDKTGIEWTKATWNPVIGCTKVSAGCKHCYAELAAYGLVGKVRNAKEPASLKQHAMADQYASVLRVDSYGAAEPAWNGETTIRPDEVVNQPLRWTKPRMIFVCSMSDLFHETVSSDTIFRVLDVIQQTPRHTYQLLTKRPKRMREMLARYQPTPLPNLWAGTTIENQAAADERIPHLVEAPATVRWLNIEPMLGPIEFMDPRLHWVVFGPGRHCDWAWIRYGLEQCRVTGIPAFVKQIEYEGRLTKKPEDWPQDLRVREYPI